MRKKTVMAGAVAFIVLAAAYGPNSMSVSADNQAAVQSPLSGSSYQVLVDGEALTLDAPARLSGSTMMVPARNIAEALGAVVTYDHESQTVTAVKGETTVILYLGSRKAEKNGSTLELDAAALKDGAVTMVPLRFFSEAFGTVVKWDGENGRVLIDNESNLLPALGSVDKLKELLQAAQEHERSWAAADGATMEFAVTAATESKASAPAAPAAGSSGASADSAASSGEGSSDYSSTNVQVEGVDEADVVKTDGKYIYQVNRNRIVIAEANPEGEMKLLSTIALGEQNMVPLELYVDGDRLVVIGNASTGFYGGAEPMPMPMPGIAAKMTMPRFAGSVKTVLYDISSREHPKAVKEVESEGSYVTSRKIGDSLYVITNQYLDRYGILNGQAEAFTPSYRDSAAGAEAIPSKYEDIRYFPDTAPNSYLQIAGIDTSKPEKQANVSVYLGAGEQVYASERNLYVTMTHYEALPAAEVKTDGSTPVTKDRISIGYGDRSSTVYKFLMDDGQVRFAAKGAVPGTVLNQFSMDEQNGYLRIATTKGDMWATGERTSKNNLYVLNESMAITGKIEDIAPGEKIYSVRFMGNRGYMVTFRKVDPLFVLDLADPANPSVLGKLKIPGYSDYLHPYDETHIIGFGKDTIEMANEWANGMEGAPTTTAYYQGMKIAMFDVSDVANPIELFKETIGDRGTDSELLRNHKALLFSKEKNLLAFPVTVAEVDKNAPVDRGFPAYGQFAFQGAYVYRVDLADGFNLRGTITHLGEDEMKKAGMDWYGSGRNIDRLLYIKDTLYTLSQSEIRASDLGSLETKSRLLIP